MSLVQSVDVNEVVFRGVVSILESQGEWVGTMTNLTTALNRILSKKQRALLPHSPGALRMVLNKVVNRLRNRRLSVKFVRTPDHKRTRLIKITQ